MNAARKLPSLTTKALANVEIELKRIQSKAERSPSEVGFLLKHKYTTKGLQPHLLKGEDKGLNEYLADKEWKCELMSVLTRYQTNEVRPYGPCDDGDEPLKREKQRVTFFTLVIICSNLRLL